VRANKKPTAVFGDGLQILFVPVQPPIAKAQATPALRGHVACIGVELTLAMTEFIDYRRTLNQPRQRSIDNLIFWPASRRFHEIFIGEK
jgi:hypothetical protein